ncbi:MAG: hypothetical protein FWD11_10130 [Micrococcales bacterium]|nr:hypothetical protein [Micrococcales bacterium]
MVATGDGGLHLVSDGSDRTAASAHLATATDIVHQLLATTHDVSHDGDPDDVLDRLTVTDGRHAWNREDLAEVNEVDDGAPGWLQMQAALNNLFASDQ